MRALSVEDEERVIDGVPARGEDATAGDVADATRSARPPLSGRLQVALLVMGVVALIAAVAMLGAGGITRPVSGVDPSATLDAALADGTPAYVLVHSLT